MNPLIPALMLFPLIFTTPEGKVKISLPETVYQRDSVAGVIELEPSGNTEAKRKAQLKKLKTYDLVISSKATSLADATFEWEIPNVPSNDLVIDIIDPRFRIIDTKKIPLHPFQNNDPIDFEFPRVAYAGEILEIHGPFNGKFSDSLVQIGAQRLKLIAESSHWIFAEIPPDALGTYQLIVIEGARLEKREIEIHSR